jgi:hypothetical protein
LGNFVKKNKKTGKSTQNRRPIALTKNRNLVMMKRVQIDSRMTQVKAGPEHLLERNIYEETKRTSDKIR